MKSMIEHHIAGMRCFARERFEKRRTVRYYRGTFLYHLYVVKDAERRYGEGIMPLIAK